MEFDLVVIGSGPGGYKAAVTAAQLGARVALVERDLPGGTCLNQGCVPKKTLLYLATLMEDVNALNGRGLIGRVEGDFPAAVHHKDEVIRSIRENFPVWLRRLGVRIIQGEGRLTAPHRVEVSEGDGRRQLYGHRVILATGSAPRELAACPTDGERVLTSRDFMFRMHDLPASILCIGGGAVGTELGYLLNQFGARVTLAERTDRLLQRPCIPARASRFLERKLADHGLEIRKGVTVTGSRADDGTGVHATFSDGTEETYDRVLVAVGRDPVTAGLGLEAAGLETDAEGFIPTNEFAETAIAGHYAIGDLTHGPMTANAALHDAKVAAFNAVKGNHMKHNYHRVPIVIDSAVEIAAVGLTEEQAEIAGFEPDVARSNFGASAKARGRRDTDGFIEVVHDEETGQLLGGCIVGAEASEQIHMLSAACHSQRGLWFFTDMNYSHPSWCEELENAIDPYTSALSKSGQELFRPGIFASSQDLREP